MSSKRRQCRANLRAWPRLCWLAPGDSRHDDGLGLEGTLSIRFIARCARVVCAGGLIASGVVGCLGGDDTSAASFDSGLIPFDAAFPTFDGGPGDDDASSLPDGATTPDGAVVIDAGPPPPTQASLVSGGTSSRSPSYVLVGTTGPATAPVLRSPNYQLVGSMSVSMQQH